jgi:hypothetical protein
MKEIIDMISEFTDELDEFKPVIQKLVEKLKGFGPEIDSLIRIIFFGVLDMYADGVERLKNDHGLPTDEAIQLIVGTKSAFHEFSRNLERTKK